MTAKGKNRALAFSSAIVACAAAMAPGLAQAQSADNAGGLEEVIVTAQKRAQNVQDVPIAITAINSKTLESTAASLNSTSLQQFVPGLVMARSGTAGATFLRGIGTEAGGVGIESPVATYLDGVYLGVNSLGVFELNNIAQVSVLKGPQGTLFGRNAAGGAIQITTRDPNLSEAEGNLEVGYGNYETSTARFYGSAPLTDKLAANVALLYKNRSKGTLYNVFTRNDSQAEKVLSGQGKLLWEPTSKTQVKLSYLYSDGDDLPGVGYMVQKGAISQDGRTVYVGPHSVNLYQDPYMEATAKIAALSITHDFGWARLTSLTSNVDFMNQTKSDQAMTTGLPNPGNVGASNADLGAKVKESSQELQLQSATDSALQWILGAYYFTDKTNTVLRSFRQAVANGPLLPGFGLDSRMGTDSLAFYAQGTGEIFAATNLTLGVRYTKDTKSFGGRNTFGGGLSANVPTEVDFNKMTWRAALDHQVNDDVMIYGSYNRGFRAGTYSPLALNNPPARPETVDAFEIGLKSYLFDRALRVNTAAFYYDYTDLQIRINVGSPTVALIQNAAQARVYGLDVDFEALPTENLRLYGGFQWLNAEYTSFPSGTANYPVGVAQLGRQPITAIPAGCTGTLRTGFGHSNSLSCNLTGNSMINAPDISISAALDYTIPTSFGDIVLSAADKYTGKAYATIDNFQVLQAYHWVTASVGWTSPSKRYYGRIWGTNLADTDRPAQLTTAQNTYQFVPGEPRLYGITFGAKF